MTEHHADATLRFASNALVKAGIVGGADDAFLLFHHATGLDRLDILKEPKTLIDAARIDALKTMLEERIAGKPVGRIIGKREVYDLELTLNAATLEPRDDTGALIEAVFPFVQDRITQSGSCSILDIGTGTGLIALSILKFFDKTTATGTDISAEALGAATSNAEKNGVGDRFRPLLSDGFAAVSGTFDLIVSNPPYIRSDVVETLSPEVRNHDPMIALDGGADGLDFYRLIAKEARQYSSASGMVAVEIGYDQKRDVIALFEAENWRTVSAHKDLGGNDRALLFN